MKVSVIIPTFNRIDCLVKAIDSVIAQKFNDWEMIVVNDGDKDNTQEVLAELSARDNRIKFVKGPQAGPAGARNTGLKIASGKFIAFLDDDDYWDPDMLKDQVLLHESRPETIGLSFTDGFVVNEKGEIQRDLLAQENSNFDRWIVENREKGTECSVGDLYPLLIRDCLMSTSCSFIPARVLAEVGVFNEDYRVGEDYDLWLRIAEKFPFGLIAKKLAYYQITDSGLSGNSFERSFVWHAAHARMLRDRLPLTAKKYQKAMVDVFCGRAMKAAWYARTQKDMKQLKEMSGLIVRYKPWLIKYWFFYGFGCLKMGAGKSAGI